MRYRKRIITLALTILLSFLIYLSEDELDKTEASHTSTFNQSKPSAFTENSDFVIYDDQGYSTTINSMQALYFPSQNLVKITAPRIKLASHKGSNISISAKTGEYFSDTETLTLKGNVIITQAFPNDKTRVMKSQEFSYNSNTQFLTTKYAVEIEQDQSIINAVGLNAWISDHKIELLSKVRGHYEPTKI